MPDEPTGATTPVTGAAQEQQTPKELDKFKNPDGTLDVTKLSNAYLSSEKSKHAAEQQRAEIQREFDLYTAGFGQPDTNAGGGTPDVPPASDHNAAGRVSGDERPVTTGEVKGAVNALISVLHPELAMDEQNPTQPKNPDFYDGLITYLKSLPLQMRQSIAAGDFEATNWAVNHYKAFSKAKGNAGAAAGGDTTVMGGPKPNFVEGSAASAQAPGGTVYSRSAMRRLSVQNPEEYSRLADDYGKALNEGRVKE